MRTKLLFVILGIFSCFGTNAQSKLYKAAEADIGLIVAFPTNPDLNIGFGGYFEPRYNVADRVSAGVRFEVVAIASNEGAIINGDVVEINVSGVTSFLLTGDYYFTDTYIRPFAGAGVGLFILGDVDYVSEQVVTDRLGTRFGYVPRIGIEASHLRLTAEYNIITGLTEINSRDYIGLKLAITIGGGRK
ncbi:MAG TPA: hypothetical protein VK212_10310 [Lentimicrobium sp.]|nr:hypothetical protein [Lentimicrobium sp.]